MVLEVDYDNNRNKPTLSALRIAHGLNPTQLGPSQGLLRAARRFCTRFSVIINGTFNTNRLRLPLIMIYGVLNTGRTFLVSFSFYPSESREAFEFIFKSRKVNYKGCDPAVMITN